jgi:2-oxoglutarate ferredoxin oxidoreductase subunit alpha
MMADAFDIADQLQTPVLVMTDLDLGMNDHMSSPFVWDKKRVYKKGKVLSADDLESIEKFGRYLDTDGDGVPYRTIPATHPTKGSYFTRGSSHDEYAVYTEDSDTYVRNMERLLTKHESSKKIIPPPHLYQKENKSKYGFLFYGTSNYASEEAMDLLNEKGIDIDAIRIKAFPFNKEVESFIDSHEKVFVIEQNRDAQMRTLLINELDITPKKLIKILNFDGTPITADFIVNKVIAELPKAQIKNKEAVVL